MRCARGEDLVPGSGVRAGRTSSLAAGARGGPHPPRARAEDLVPGGGARAEDPVPGGARAENPGEEEQLGGGSGGG